MEKYELQLARYQFQMGTVRGRLATVLDILTDALALVGQHGVYCQNRGGSDDTAMDVRSIMDQLEDSKGLILESMQELKAQTRGRDA